MAEADLHLKLDRLIAGQGRILARQDEQDATVGALTGGLSALADGLATQREMLATLLGAVTDEGAGGNEMRELITRLERHLGQIAADGERMVTIINGLPRAMSDAAMDGVRLAMGDGVDVPHPEPGA